MIGPGDEIAAGQSGLPTSGAGREQVIEALKTAFVQGRLTRDEFDLRVSKVLAAYAELDDLTADIPAGPAPARSPGAGQPPGLARESHNRKVIQRGTAAGAGATMAFTAAMVTVAGGPLWVGLVVVPLAGFFMAVLLAGLLTLFSWALEKGSARQATPGLPPGPGGQASGRPAPAEPAAPVESADPAGPARQARRFQFFAGVRRAVRNSSISSWVVVASSGALSSRQRPVNRGKRMASPASSSTWPQAAV